MTNKKLESFNKTYLFVKSWSEKAGGHELRHGVTDFRAVTTIKYLCGIFSMKKTPVTYMQGKELEVVGTTPRLVYSKLYASNFTVYYLLS